MLKEILEITNKKYEEILNSIALKIEQADIETSEKNLMLMATDRMIKIYKNYFRDSPIESVENARSVYEMVTKAVTMSESQEIKDSYEKIDKPRNEQNDNPGQIRNFVHQHFNEYFSLIEDDEIIKQEFPKGVLDYIYSCLSRYTHPSKEKEFIFEVLKNDKCTDFALIAIYMEYIEPVMIIYLDLVSTKYKNMQEEIELLTLIFVLKFLTFIFLYLPINKNVIIEVMDMANNFFEHNKNNEEYYKKLQKVSLNEFNMLKGEFSNKDDNVLIVKKLAEALETIFSLEEKEVIKKEYTRFCEDIKEVIAENKKLMSEYINQ